MTSPPFPAHLESFMVIMLQFSARTFHPAVAAAVTTHVRSWSVTVGKLIAQTLQWQQMFRNSTKDHD